jgi:hypothetical protein
LQVGRSTAGVLALGDWPDRMDMPVRTSPGSITALTIEVLHGGVLVRDFVCRHLRLYCIYLTQKNNRNFNNGRQSFAPGTG